MQITLARLIEGGLLKSRGWGGLISSSHIRKHNDNKKINPNGIQYHGVLEPDRQQNTYKHNNDLKDEGIHGMRLCVCEGLLYIILIFAGEFVSWIVAWQIQIYRFMWPAEQVSITTSSNVLFLHEYWA